MQTFPVQALLFKCRSHAAAGRYATVYLKEIQLQHNKAYLTHSDLDKKKKKKRRKERKPTRPFERVIPKTFSNDEGSLVMVAGLVSYRVIYER